MTQENIWQGKVAIVTGGSSGIGKATAQSLRAQGAHVLITGRDAARLDAIEDNIETLQIDSGDPTSGAKIVEVAQGLWGRVDLIVNNAGAGHPMPMGSYETDAIAQMSMVNIISPSLLIKASCDALRESKGAIVNIGSAVSRNSVPMLAHYAATKAALEHLTRSWAAELAEAGVRVNAVAPGPVKSGALTGMMGLPEEMAQQIEAQEKSEIPLGRRGLPQDIVPWILRLGSSDNQWLTGQVLTIDGGWTIRG
jgi:NAD(P)-dependent dehydrogenase (short-subunit alcohol dehydrogenase family)